MPDNNDGTVVSRPGQTAADGTAASRPKQAFGEETVASRLAQPLEGATEISESIPSDYGTVSSRLPGFEPLPPLSPEPPPKKRSGRMMLASCGGCLLVVLLAGGVGAFLAMRGKGRLALPFFGVAKTTVRGTIYDPSHRPLHMRLIQVVVHLPAGGGSKDLSTEPGADGTYTISVPKGPCTIECSLLLARDGKNIAIPLIPSPVVAGSRRLHKRQRSRFPVGADWRAAGN